MNDSLVQYIIVRNDMDSMTPGRCAAQAAHAANHCVKVLQKTGGNSVLKEWEEQTKDSPYHGCGFGTTIVLQADLDTIKYYHSKYSWEPPFRVGLVVDPEYHIQDGDVTHIIENVTTAMWIFGKKSDIEPYVENLELL